MIFEKVRYMNAAGLERKCDIQAYVKKVGRMCDQEALAGQSGQGL